MALESCGTCRGFRYGLHHYPNTHGVGRGPSCGRRRRIARTGWRSLRSRRPLGAGSGSGHRRYCRDCFRSTAQPKSRRGDHRSGDERKPGMISVEHLSKHYRAVTAVKDVTFTVPNGVITGFLGPNGAGKSTTMRAMLGLDRPTSGIALTDGQPLSGHDRPATAAGAVLDTSWFHPGRTGLAHLKIAAASAGLTSRSARDALSTVGMTSAAHRRVGAYSLGMKQRLGLATAMLGRPRNIILDEPMNGLDPQGMEWMRTYLR